MAQSSRGGSGSGRIPQSFRTLSRIVSSGASSVASTVKSAASAALRDGDNNHDQVTWAGFDKLELDKGVERQVLLLGFHRGFQVWDVEVANDVCKLASRQDAAVSSMQMQPIPQVCSEWEDKFAHHRPLLVICGNESLSEDDSNQENRSTRSSINESHMPTIVWFYSLNSRSYVHLLRFRSVVHLVRCSCRIVAVLQSAQIHCLNAATLEREYTVLTNPITPGSYGSGNIGLGPLAVGSRWMAYSGSIVQENNSDRVSPQNLTSAATLSEGVLSHYAKETGKQLAAGIATLGDKGYRKLSRYYSDLLPDGKEGFVETTTSNLHNGSAGHSSDSDSAGMVIVKDIVQRTVIAQFQAHKSPISALCFDPSGTLLVTASVHGHNINVFRIMPGGSAGASSLTSYSHLYQLQRGFTNAVIRDISFSNDSEWIVISSSRGTSHLFSVSPFSGTVSSQSADSSFNQKNPMESGLQMLTPRSICSSDSPITLPPVRRIRTGNGWRNTMNVAAAAANGRFSLSGAVASTFHKCRGNVSRSDMKKSYFLLVFSSSGFVIQYALHFPSVDGVATSPGVSFTREPSLNYDSRLIVEAIQKWNICQKRNRKDQGDEIDMYGEKGISSSNKMNFQLLLSEDEEASSSGEVEIEKLPFQTLEPRPKELIPIYSPLHAPKFQLERVAFKNKHERFFRNELDFAGTKIYNESRSSSIDSMFNAPDSGLDEDDPGAFHSSIMDGGFVNNSEANSIKHRRASSVNNGDSGSILGNMFKEDDGFDEDNNNL